jgi:hypothetical protein
MLITFPLSYDFELKNTRQLLNLTNPVGYYGMFILNCQSKSYTIDIDLDFRNPGGEGLSCEFIPMPATTRRLLGLWSFAFACCAMDFIYNFLTRSHRMNAWGICKGMQPWLGVSAAVCRQPNAQLKSTVFVQVCIAARAIQMAFAIKTFDDMSSYGRNSTAITLLM